MRVLAPNSCRYLSLDLTADVGPSAGQAPAAAEAVTVAVLYDRYIYGGWIDADGNCQDTHQEVLIAESLVLVELDASGCTVVGGRWSDPYAGRVITNPSQLDIDHLVPLAEAHRSGGDACTPAPAVDTPAPATEIVSKPERLKTESGHPRGRVEIIGAQARLVSKQDPWVQRIVHPDDIKGLESPVLISVEVALGLGDLSRTASPVIVLDGHPVSNSIVVRNGVDRIYAVVSKGQRMGVALRIQVGWLGALNDTVGKPVSVTLKER